MRPGAVAFTVMVLAFPHCLTRPQNVFSFCRDFDATGCVAPHQAKISYATDKAVKNKTVRDFANSVYFRGDRLAFEVKNAYARWPVSFECLRGYYYFENESLDRHELEYLELREKNIYGLVMLGSLIEKKFSHIKLNAYKKTPDFAVTYSVSCGKDLLAKQQITIELQ